MRFSLSPASKKQIEMMLDHRSTIRSQVDHQRKGRKIVSPLVSADDFAPWVGRNVRVKTYPQPVEIKLDRIARQDQFPMRCEFREPFSLFFVSPETVYLLDGTYEFDCGRGGPHMIFISQLKPGEGCRRYQAVFF
jgi:hypothetical protein